MRAAISLLVSSLILGSLAGNCEAKLGQLSHLLLAKTGSQQLVSVKPRPRPEKPAHRGSGRRELMESFRNTRSIA
jgi:hypothetical protein